MNEKSSRFTPCFPLYTQSPVLMHDQIKAFYGDVTMAVPLAFFNSAHSVDCFLN